MLAAKAANDGMDGSQPVDPAHPNPADMVKAIHDAAVWLGAKCNAGEGDSMNKATAQAAMTGDDDTDPLGELQQIMDALEEADPADVANLASQAIGVLQQLGALVPRTPDPKMMGEVRSPGDLVFLALYRSRVGS